MGSVQGLTAGGTRDELHDVPNPHHSQRAGVPVMVRIPLSLNAPKSGTPAVCV